MTKAAVPPLLDEALVGYPSFREALDAHAMIVITDLTGRIRDINDRLVELSGFARDELIGATHAIMHSGRQDRAFYEEMWRTISADRIWRGTLCNRAKSGHLYWLATTIGPLFDIRGRKVGYVGLRTDITREKLGHLLLEREQSLHARLHEGARLSVLAEELLGEIEEIRPELRLAVMRVNERGRLCLLASPRMPEAYLDAVEGVASAASGLPNARAVRTGRPVFFPTPGEVQPQRHRASEGLLHDRAEAAAWWSFPIRGPDGRVLGVLDVFADVVRDPDAIERYLLESLAAGLSVALFHQRSIELHRRYMAEMETLALQREGVLRTIGHELRTPLNHILGFADLLVQSVEDPRLREWASFIRTAGRDLMRKVEKSESFLSADPEGGHEEVRLAAHLTKLVRDWSARHRRHVEIEASEEDPRIEMSRADLERAMEYLLENVERHTPDGTRLVLSIRRRGDEAVIELSDDGPGAQGGEAGLGGLIRETRELGSRQGGLGLGLAAARHLVQRNGGRMMIGTSSEEGFTVLVRLPLARAGDADRHARAQGGEETGDLSGEREG